MNSAAGPAKWILKWMGHETLSATMVGRQEKSLNSRRSRMAKTVII